MTRFLLFHETQDAGSAEAGRMSELRRPLGSNHSPRYRAHVPTLAVHLRAIIQDIQTLNLHPRRASAQLYVVILARRNAE